MKARIVVVGALAVVFGSLGTFGTSHAAGGSAITFTHEVTVDPNRANGEPDVAIADNGKEMYTSGPWGFSTTVSMAWKSDDGGAQWDLLHGSCPANPLRPFCSRGGGDSEVELGTPQVQNGPQEVYFADLNGLDTITCAYSSDGGDTFTVSGSDASGHVCNDAAGNQPGSDRQWIAVCHVGQPCDGNNTLDTLYMVYDTGESPPGGDAALISTDGGHNWTAQCTSVVPLQSCVGGNNAVGSRPGPVLINQATGTLYEFMGTSNNGAEVNISCDGGTTWANKPFAGNMAGSTTNDFVAGAIDTAGNLYATFAVDGGTNRWLTYYAHSTDANGTSGIGNCADAVKGGTWSAPVAINGPGTGASTVNYAVMPWITAGDPGRVDIAYYGDSTDPVGTDPSSDANPLQTWYVHMSQTLNGLDASPVFSDVQASETPNHHHSICFSGIGCTGTGDRNLADFFEVRPDPQGRAVILYVDDNNSQPGPPAVGFSGAGLISSVQQASGPGLYANVNGGLVSAPTTSLTQSVGLDNQVSDAAGDALLPEHQPAPGPNADAADITNLTVAPKGANTLAFTFTVKNFGGSLANAVVNDAATAAAGEAHTGAIFLVSWHFHNDFWFASATVDQSGHVQYLAGLPDDVFSSSAPKALQYTFDPANNHQVTGVPDTMHNTLEIDVPLADIGNPSSGDTLYGLTGYTADTSALATVPDLSAQAGFFDNIDQTAPIDAAVSGSPTANTPEVPAVPLLLGFGGVALAGTALWRRRRRLHAPTG